MGVAKLKHGKLKSVTLNDRRGEVIERYEAGVITDNRPPMIHTPRPVGFGDLVATFAQPIAAAIDALTERLLTAEHRTELAKCSACARRHRKGNLLCPDITTCPILAHLLASLPSFARDAILAAAARYAKPPA
jgi:hypothetical protein